MREMFLHRLYPPMQFRPERNTSGSHWSVWCAAGAAQVLGLREYREHDVCTLTFANGACARIAPGDDLWKALEAVIKDGFRVETFGLSMAGGYVTWTGEEGSMTEFDAIQIFRF